jgi:AcrR family transcriptional regulator
MPSADPRTPAQRRKGRRGPSKKLDAAITEATRRLLRSVGPAGVTFEGVAREVGCSKASLYRRHSSKESMILAATMDLFATPPSEPLDGRVLHEVIASRAKTLMEPGSVPVLTMMMNEAIASTEFGRSYLEVVYEPIRTRRGELLEAAAAKGQIRRDADIDLLLDVISGTLLFRRAHHQEYEPDLPGRLTALLLDGLRPTGE